MSDEKGPNGLIQALRAFLITHHSLPITHH